MTDWPMWMGLPDVLLLPGEFCRWVRMWRVIHDDFPLLGLMETSWNEYIADIQKIYVPVIERMLRDKMEFPEDIEFIWENDS